VHYWNKPNFEGLLQIAEALEADQRLLLLAEYCRQRELGLRRKAFDALERFLRVSAGWNSSESRTACQKVLELHARTSEAHQFLTQPLLTRFIYPVLEAWQSDEPQNQTALRWLGILRMNSELLTSALALSPEDVPVRRRLADWCLSDVEHATHHLGESQLLGDLEDTKESLARARAVVEAAPDSAPFADLQAEISEFEAMLTDWESYSSSPDGSFPEWCASRNRPYSWPTIVYYQK
jgi:hypothetical protein